jgi:hypothetical protein
MEMEPYKVIQFYCGRGKMENFIKEGKIGFDFASVSSQAKNSECKPASDSWSCIQLI